MSQAFAYDQSESTNLHHNQYRSNLLLLIDSELFKIELTLAIAVSVISNISQIDRTQSEPPNSPSNRDHRELSQPLSLLTEIAGQDFDPLEAAKNLLKSKIHKATLIA